MRHELTRKNASRGPHVDGGRVELGAEEDVRRAVPQRDDLGRVAPHRDAERPRQPEVSQLQLAALVDQQVLGLRGRGAGCCGCGSTRGRAAAGTLDESFI